MVCTFSNIFTFTITENLVPYFWAYTVVTSAFNISGSSFLLWALKKTGQTKTTSFQFIIIMSINGLVASMSNAIVLTLITWLESKKACWISSLEQFLAGTLNTVSFFMIILIALDRYLHMRYLERYPSIVTKKRGHLLAVVAFLVASILNGILILPVSESKIAIIHVAFVVSVCPFLMSIFMLYRGAMRALREKSSQLTQNIINQTRALSTAAKRVTICITALTIPLFALQAVELADKYKSLMNSTLINNMKPFAYATYTFNVFCSSIIFMSQNRPIRILIKGIGRCPHTRRRSVVWPVDANMQNRKAVQGAPP